MRTAIYVRVSTSHQVEHQTIAQQLERLRTHVQAQSWSLSEDHIYRDDGFSGASLARPGLDRLRDAVRARELDRVVLTAPDRLARNYVHQMVLLEEFAACGCQVEFLDRPMSNDPHDQLLLQIRGAVAEYERTLIAERMRRGRLSKLQAGLMLPWTHAPYGYRLHPDRPRDPSGVTVELAEAAVVAELFVHYLEPEMSLAKLAKGLNQRGLPTPFGNHRWTSPTIRGILRNPTYTGKVYAQRTRYQPAQVRRSATHPLGHPLAFVASGHVAIFDGVTKQPRALFRMSPGSGGARQAHAAEWLKDGSALIVANQNGKLLERIGYDAATDSFFHDTGATLNLATCTTPGGRPCQSTTPLSDLDPAFLGLDNRPDNAPICPVISQRGHAFVTLRGGGLFVVDPTVIPMAIVAAYGNAVVRRDGCGGLQDKKNVYLNGGTGTLATNPTEFSLYHFRDEYPFSPAALADNDPLLVPDVFFRDTSPHRDAHGMAVTEGSVRYLWQFDRLANVAEVFRLPSKRHVRTVDLTASGVSGDPTPDIIARSPNGDRFYAALRGPRPQTGAHASAGSTPGLGIVTLSERGANGSLTHVLPTSFTNPVDGGQESDPHGISIRRIDP